MVTRSNSTADSEPTRPRTPPETVPAHDPTVDGVRWSDEEIVDASQWEPKLWLTHRIIEASTPGTLRTSAAIWVKNSLPKMIARRRAQALALPPTIADAWPRDRPRRVSARMPGSSAVANSHASRMRNRKWRVTENSHSPSSSAATRHIRMAPERRTDR